MHMKTVTLLLMTTISLPSAVIAAQNADFHRNTILADATANTTANMPSNDYKNAKQKFKNMTPEQRKEFRANIKSKWDAMSAQDKQTFKTSVKDRADKLKQKMEQKHKTIDEDKIYMRIYGFEELNK